MGVIKAFELQAEDNPVYGFRRFACLFCFLFRSLFELYRCHYSEILLREHCAYMHQNFDHVSLCALHMTSSRAALSGARAARASAPIPPWASATPPCSRLCQKRWQARFGLCWINFIFLFSSLWTANRSEKKTTNKKTNKQRIKAMVVSIVVANDRRSHDV